jgi:hypothetical protein
MTDSGTPWRAIAKSLGVGKVRRAPARRDASPVGSLVGIAGGACWGISCTRNAIHHSAWLEACSHIYRPPLCRTTDLHRAIWSPGAVMADTV